MCRVQINLNRYATEAGKGAFVAGLPDVVAKITKAQQVVYIQDNQRSKETITFNVDDYKTNHEFKWPKKGLQILEKKPEERSKEDIRTLCNLMRGLHSFRKYSRTMQTLICKVMRYQKYGRRRVVIRKGHPGYSFYFIFSGSVCVTLDEDEESIFTKKEVTILRKGVSFGEIALLKDVHRMATIMCLEDTELLIVDRDEFFDNGLHLHIQREFQYRLNFFRSLDIFSSWPIEKLEEISDMGRIEEYCYDSVVVPDSTENEWLLFITKRLVDLAKIYSAQLKEEQTAVKKPLKRERSRSDLLRGDYPLSLLPEGYQTRYPWLVPVSLPERPKTTGQISRRTSAEETNRNGLAGTRSKSAGINREESTRKQDSRDDLLPPELRHQLDDEYSNKRADEMEEPKLPEHMTLGLSTIKGPDVDAGVYIRVNSLGPGQCFGTESITGEMPKLSLMSLGCEVIRVSLSKFKEYADEKTLEKIQKITPKYPNNHFLWSNFQEQNNWNSFKHGVVQDVIDNHAQAVTPNTFARDLRKAPGSLSPKQGANAYRRNSLPTPSKKSNPMPKILYSANQWIDNKIPNSYVPRKANHLNSNRSTFGGSSRASTLLSRPKTSTNRVRSNSRPASTLPTIQTSSGQVDYSYHPIRTYSIANRPQSVHIGSGPGPSRSIKRPSTSVRK
ncbi:Cyclic nucleotide-binding domain-containing protein 2 [Holothuria leucospilota]|uniref:Cyclic nucleotide-binding domain-containing protein 2 n=1 Tax=Holothuria leucospilota TaxID=206669 RepID=A0A9Q1C0Y5_HOLLE|nr:Cyclic nucleotide-binding domain-containing protein 2 [Holothuria leucospilota]